MTTPVFGISELIASQSQPHVTVNAAIRALEVLTNPRVLDKDLGTPPGSPSEGARYIVPTGATGDWLNKQTQIAYYSGGGWLFIVPESGMRAYVVDEDAFYEFSAGSPYGAWTAVPGGGSIAASAVTYTGANAGSPTVTNVEAALAILFSLVGTAPPPYDLGTYVAGLPDAGGTVLHWNAVRAFTLPSGLSGSYARCRVNATSSAVFTIYKNGSSIGTITFAAGSPGNGVISFSSSQSFAIGDQLRIVAPASQDATLAGVSISLKGTRT